MKRIPLARWTIAGWLLAGALSMSLPAPAHADASLQLNPLRYDDTLGSTVKNGYIDVANPSDTTVTVSTSVKGFKQADLDGNLKFFDDPELSAGIRPGLTEFELGPRESIRVVFSVDPIKLPTGGVYAAIFFRTVLPEGKSDLTVIREAANVGTLLMLRNGGKEVVAGSFQAVNFPRLQLGQGLTGAITFANTNRDTNGLAFEPRVSVQAYPWGQRHAINGPFIMPSSARQFVYRRPGSYFGLLPVTLQESRTNAQTTVWVFACTGWYREGVFFGLVLLVAWATRKRWRR